MRDGSWLAISVSSSSSEGPSYSMECIFNSAPHCKLDAASAELGMLPLYMEVCSILLLEFLFSIEAALSKDARSWWVLNSGSLLPKVDLWLEEQGYSLVFPSSVELAIEFAAEWIDDIDRRFLFRIGLLAVLKYWEH